MSESVEETWTSAQAAAYLARSSVTLRRWRKDKVGPAYYRIQTKVYYRPSDVHEWIEKQRVAR